MSRCFSYPLRRSPVFWLGLLGVVFLGFAWWDSVSDSSGVKVGMGRAGNITLYSGGSAIRLRALWGDDARVSPSLTRWLFFRSPGFETRSRTLMAGQLMEKPPGYFPGSAWESFEVAEETILIDGVLEKVGPYPLAVAARRFDLLLADWGSVGIRRNYSRRDIVLPYAELVAAYAAGWAGLLAWRMFRWHRMQRRAGITHPDP